MTDSTELKNYAFDIYDIDTGTLSGIDRYIEWLEELILDPVKYQSILKDIEEHNNWETYSKYEQ